MEAVATFLELTLEQALLSGAGAVPKKSLDAENYSGFRLGKPEPKANPAGEEENIDEIIVSNDDLGAAAGGFSRAAYSFPEEQFLAGLQYDAPALDYVKLWYGEKETGRAEYVSGAEAVAEAWHEGESEILTVQEAAETFMDIQYHALQGNVYQVNAEDRRRFDLWIKFNLALFKLLESTQGLTRDVNYAVN